MSFCPQAIVFDMDGLLVDTEPLWQVAEMALLEKRGKAYDATHHAPLIGLGLNDFFTQLAALYAIEEEPLALKAEVVAHMAQLIVAGIHARPGAAELVAYVRDHNLPRAIASSSPHNLIEAVVSVMGWEDVFTVRCSGEEVPNGKPAPDVYLLAAQKLGVAPADCLALEDSVNGARAAVAAGMTCYAVPDLSHTRVERFADITPHVYADLNAVRATLAGC